MVAGAAIYFVFRRPVFFTDIFIQNGLTSPLVHLHDGVIAYFLCYVMPDICWCLSLMLFATCSPFRFTKIAAATLPFFFELGQLVGVIAGTFDIYDLLSYSLIIVIFFLIWKRNQKFHLSAMS